MPMPMEIVNLLAWLGHGVVGEGSRRLTLWGPSKLARDCEGITSLSGEEVEWYFQGFLIPFSTFGDI